MPGSGHSTNPFIGSITDISGSFSGQSTHTRTHAQIGILLPLGIPIPPRPDPTQTSVLQTDPGYKGTDTYRQVKIDSGKQWQHVSAYQVPDTWYTIKKLPYITSVRSNISIIVVHVSSPRLVYNPAQYQVTLPTYQVTRATYQKTLPHYQVILPTTVPSNPTIGYFFPSFSRTRLLSSFWTSRGHRCRPFFPPVFASNFYRA